MTLEVRLAKMELTVADKLEAYNECIEKLVCGRRASGGDAVGLEFRHRRVATRGHFLERRTQPCGTTWRYS